MFVIGLAPDGQSTNFQRNPVTSMMPYITGTLIATLIFSSLVVQRLNILSNENYCATTEGTIINSHHQNWQHIYHQHFTQTHIQR